MSVIGFDIGNENSYIATAIAGGIEVVDNEYSQRPTPTYVAFAKSSRDLGVNAKSKLVMNINNTIFGFKKILGRKFDDSVFKHENAYLPYEVSKLPSGEIGVKVNYLNGDVVFTVTQIMAMMLTKLKDISEIKIGNKIRDCVISVPVYYSEPERRAMLQAAEIADLNPLKLMNEPTAIALAYGFYQQNLTDVPQNVIFVDIGNSALTVSACAFTKDKLQILGCAWDRNIGGRDFDNLLVKYFTEEFKNRYQLDVLSNKKALMTLIMECESLKKQMSASSLEISFNIECFMNDRDVSGKMKRNLFEKLLSQILTVVEKTLRKILNVVPLENIHSVQIVGGSCRIPVIKSLIQTVFGREPSVTLNIDEAVARGCALQCALLSPTLRTRNFIVEDTQPYSIYFRLKMIETETVEVFPAHHKTPASKAITFITKLPFSVEVIYSNLSGPGIESLGTYTFQNATAEVLDATVKVKLKAYLDINGIFSINSATALVEMKEIDAIDNITPTESDEAMDDKDEINSITDDQNKDIIEIKPKKVWKSYELDIRRENSVGIENIVDLKTEEQQMVQWDKKEREKADARNKLEEYIYEMRAKLSFELEEFAETAEKNKLSELLNDVESWLYQHEDQDVKEYYKRLIQLKISFEPVVSRFAEWGKRPAAIGQFLKVLHDAFEFLSSIDEKVKKSHSEDLNSLLSLCGRSQEQLAKSQTVLDNLKKHESCPLTAECLQKERKIFEKQYQVLFNRLKAKLESVDVSGDDKQDEDPNSKSSDTTEISDCAETTKSEEQTGNELSPNKKFCNMKID